MVGQKNSMRPLGVMKPGWPSGRSLPVSYFLNSAAESDAGVSM